MHLVLYRPSIPPNTGNAGRLCVGFAAELHIVGPCEFDFSDKALRRAGLDYWPHLTWTLHPDEDEFLDWLGDRKPWLITKHGKLRFDEPDYDESAVLILGNEVDGISPSLLKKWPDRTVKIPILGPIRAYNLANAAAIVLAHAKLKCGALDGAG